MTTLFRFIKHLIQSSYPFFAFLIAFALCSHEVRAEDTLRSLKIGLVLPLSGELASLGEGIRNGALLAEEDLRSEGKNVTLLFEDGRGELSPSMTAASKLIQRDKVAGIISIISGVARIISPLATRAHIINVGICSDTEVADGNYNFVNYLTAEQGVARYLQHYKKIYGENASLGIFVLNEPGFLKIIDVLRDQSNNHPPLSFVETYNGGEREFSSILTRSLSKNAENLLLLGLSPEIELIARQAQEIGYSIPLTSIESFGLATDKSSFEGSWYVDSAVPQKAFEERYKQRYGIEVTPGVGHAYDTVMLVAKARGVPGQFRELGSYKGVTGPLEVKPNGVIWSEASVKEIQEGRAVLIDDNQ